jgi:hypothetical protein
VHGAFGAERLVAAAIIAVIGASGIAEALTARIQQSIAEMATGQGGEAGGGGPGGSQPAVARPAPAPAAEGADDEPSALERLGGGLADFAGGATDLAGDAAGGVSGFVADNAGGALDTLVSGAQGAGALLDGALLGDIHASGYENPWLESLRAVGHTASGVVVLGDARDILFNAGKVAWTGGEQGKADLGLSAFALIPWVGDAARGAKAADGAADAFRAADRASDGARAAPAPRAEAPAPRGPACSFTATTPVLMADGRSKAIADIAVGERVIATDPRGGETGARAVERVIVGEGRKTLVRVRVSGQILTATDNHPFWVESRGAWVDAAELRRGDVLREPGGERAAVESVRILAPRRERVHNLTVAGLHTYYAGKAPVLVHNANCSLGDMVPSGDRDPAADALAKRLGGRPSVKFSTDPKGREFDAVSDDCIGQTKMSGRQVGSRLRNQAKATFEAAKATDRRPYFHFDEAPSPGVVEKLADYARRYGLEPVIDTQPLPK